MNFFESTFDEFQLYEWEELIGDWFFIASIIFLCFELVRLFIKKKLNKNVLGDAVTNFVTLGMFMGINLLLIGAYIGAFYFFYEYVSFVQLPINVLTIVACIILADLAYYWEHRAMHRFGIGWATHTVHHSSPHFNISVAYRFGPLDGVIPLFFHIPLAMLGFHPFVILFAEMMVQLYQTALHTEAVRKLPKPVEAVMNTPSHHRVHHGSNPQYIDKNYAGIFIIWDKMFGTFEKEEEEVVYGVLPPINSINPIHVFFHGLTGLTGKVVRAKGINNKLLYLVKPPGWHPDGRK